jgi:hypothetical protein
MGGGLLRHIALPYPPGHPSVRLLRGFDSLKRAFMETLS